MSDNTPIANFDILKKVKNPDQPDGNVKNLNSDPVGSWPDRSLHTAKLPDQQISIKGPGHIIERFKQLCRDDRRHYYDMLEILMDNFERKSEG